MQIPSKLFFSVALALTLCACASTGSKTQLSENLRVAPAIDVAYSEVSQNITENIGLNVRWGGQVLSAKKVGNITELTVFANKLSPESRPIFESDDDFKGGRFIVTVPEYKQSLLSRQITVYGQVSGARTLVNGPKTKVIPVITGLETKEWKTEVASDKRGRAYYSLGYQTGHFNSFNRYGHRGFSRLGYSHFGHGFYSGNRFSRGFYSGGRFGHRGGFFGRGRH